MKRAWFVVGLALWACAACTEDTPTVSDDDGNNATANNGDNNAAPNNDDNSATNNATNNATANNGDNNAPNNAPNNSAEPRCADNTECRGGEVCREGECREACSQDDPCGQGVCELASGVCVGCLEDTDCGAQERCVERACEFFCSSDAGCANGQVCDEARGVCVEAQCQEDADCAGGFECREGLCVSIDPVVCDANVARCQDAGTLLRCSADGTRETAQACAEGEECIGEPGQARCASQQCEPFEIGCLDDQTAYACDGEGTERMALPCRDDQRCEAGACVVLACEPNARECVGGLLATCDESGSARTTRACAEGQTCLEAVRGEAACVALVCEPSSVGCSDETTRYACDETGTERTEQACPQGQMCRGEGVCSSQVCTPGQSVCQDERTRATCNAQGTGYTNARVCAEGESCEAGACVSPCAAVQPGSPLGCTFWTVDLDNEAEAVDLPHAVALFNPDPNEPVSATLRRGEQVLSEGDVIPPGGVFSYELSSDTGLEVVGVYTDSALSISTSAPVQALQLGPAPNERSYSMDASLLWPTSAVGSRYLVMSWPTLDGASGLQGFAAVVASSPGSTTVEITPTSTLVRPGGSTFAGQRYTATLTQGQTLFVQNANASGADLTGSQIVTSQPAVVFGGHECANVPDDSVRYCDHLEEQLLPEESFGEEFVLVPWRSRGDGDLSHWVVVASEDGTVLESVPTGLDWDGEVLDRGESLRIEGEAGSVLRATAPVEVAQFIQGGNFSGAELEPECNNNLLGDPSMAMLGATSTWRSAYTIYVPEGSVYDYVQVTMPTAIQGQVRLDGDVIPSPSAVGGGYSAARAEVEPGVHTLTASRPFGVLVYGYTCDASYAYAGGIGWTP